MISARDARVSNTGILVAPLEEKQQLTVYGNRVMAGSEGAMILPVPRGTRPIQLVDLSNYPDMFEKLNKTGPLTRGKGVRPLGRAYLQVVDVGSYRVSIVEDFEKFQQLDPAEFRLTPDLLRFLSQYYPTEFSFLVCKLRAGENVAYHPFGYRHELLPNGRMFIPTMHYHLDSNEHQHVDWDHSIYLWNCQIPWRNISPVFQGQPFNHGHEYVQFLTANLGLPKCHLLTQVKIDLYHRNHDLHAIPIYAVHGPTEPTTDLPDYVRSGDVYCDQCGSPHFKVGFHRDPETDYCATCMSTRDPTGFKQFQRLL